MNMVSMTTLHTFRLPGRQPTPLGPRPTNRHACRTLLSTTDLFVLHGILFTNIQLDDFTRTLALFWARLKMEGDNINKRDWLLPINALSMLPQHQIHFSSWVDSG